MENLGWFGIKSEESSIYLSSIDALSILTFIRGRDFQIIEMWGFKKNNEKDLLCKYEERFWVKKNHFIEIASLIEEDENENIISLRINLDNGDYINLIYGQLWVKISDIKLLKKCTLKILEQYGYYAANEIWNFVSQQNCDMPIYYLKGMEEKDILDSLEETRIQNIIYNQNENDILKKMKIHGHKCNFNI
jgi:hypothetical protein|tara:strand:- start:88 stop:660 length:573 start_codon:yes stop_codon:yes gene_type:complete